MFSQVYQSGDAGVEVFSASGKSPGRQWKVSSSVHKVYDKTVKGFVFLLDKKSSTPNALMQIPTTPGKDNLGLIQRYLVFQIRSQSKKPLTIEICVLSRKDKLQRYRLHMSSKFRSIEVNQLHAQIPIGLFLKPDTWTHFIVDVSSLTSLFFKNNDFGSIDSIGLHSGCRLRKVFTLPRINDPSKASDMFWFHCPYNFDFPAGTNYESKLLDISSFDDHAKVSPEYVESKGELNSETEKAPKSSLPPSILENCHEMDSVVFEKKNENKLANKTDARRRLNALNKRLTQLDSDSKPKEDLEFEDKRPAPLDSDIKAKENLEFDDNVNILNTNKHEGQERIDNDGQKLTMTSVEHELPKPNTPLVRNNMVSFSDVYYPPHCNTPPRAGVFSSLIDEVSNRLSCTDGEQNHSIGVSKETGFSKISVFDFAESRRIQEKDSYVNDTDSRGFTIEDCEVDARSSQSCPAQGVCVSDSIATICIGETEKDKSMSILASSSRVYNDIESYKESLTQMELEFIEEYGEEEFRKIFVGHSLRNC